jgi:hypothetical protein
LGEKNKSCTETPGNATEGINPVETANPPSYPATGVNKKFTYNRQCSPHEKGRDKQNKKTDRKSQQGEKIEGVRKLLVERDISVGKYRQEKRVEQGKQRPAIKEVKIVATAKVVLPKTIRSILIQATS